MFDQWDELQQLYDKLNQELAMQDLESSRRVKVQKKAALISSVLEKKAEIEWEIRRALDAELCFLEIRQYRKLINDQDIYRPEVLVLQDSLSFKVDHLRQEFQRRHYSRRRARGAYNRRRIAYGAQLCIKNECW